MSYATTRQACAIEDIAAKLPVRVIMGEQGPYLYTLRENDDGSHVYLHFFHRGDADRELHNHPWAGRSTILWGSYREERRVLNDDHDWVVVDKVYEPGDKNDIQPRTFHRVDLLTAGVWTLFETGQKVQSWHFWDRDTGVYTPWREALARRGLL